MSFEDVISNLWNFAFTPREKNPEVASACESVGVKLDPKASTRILESITKPVDPKDNLALDARDKLAMGKAIDLAAVKMNGILVDPGLPQLSGEDTGSVWRLCNGADAPVKARSTVNGR